MPVLDAYERTILDPRRHADKPLGLKVAHGPATYSVKFGALTLDDYCDTSVAVPATLPRNPATADYSYGMLDNDRYGDCVAAAIYHNQESLRLRWGLAPHPWSAATCLTFYFNSNGVSPGPPGGPSDNGTDPAVAMNYWQNTGLPGHKILGWGFAPPSSPNLRRLLYEFGAGVWAVALGVEQQTQGVDWNYVPGETPGSWGGHGVAGDSYDENGFGIISWSELGTMDDPFVANCAIGLYVPLTSAALNSADTGPGGVAFAQMRSDFGHLTQGENGP